MVEEAFSLGALAYLVKTRAGSELLAAVELICQGMRFVGTGPAGNVATELPDDSNSQTLQPDGGFLGSRPEAGD